MLALSSESSVVCKGIGTLSLPSGLSISSMATSSGTGKVTTTNTGTHTGATPTSAGVTAGATSKGAAERGMGPAVPVMGGVLGTFIGIVVVFL